MAAAGLQLVLLTCAALLGAATANVDLPEIRVIKQQELQLLFQSGEVVNMTDTGVLQVLANGLPPTDNPPHCELKMLKFFFFRHATKSGKTDLRDCLKKVFNHLKALLTSPTMQQVAPQGMKRPLVSLGSVKGCLRREKNE
jgi:hypothetical protein